MTDAQQRLIDYPQAYLGLAELAEVLGLSKGAASNARSRGKLPEPEAELALGPVWSKQQIAQWLGVAAQHATAFTHP